MDVTINGQPYAPTTRVGLAISTYNRQWVLDEALGHYLKHTPDWMPIVVVDDASKEPAVVPDRVTLVRQDVNLGIAGTKNRCIAELMDLGVEHLFLADDDVWPTTDGWWLPYVESPEPHLMMLFKAPGNPKDPPTVYDDGTLYSLAHPRGCLLYADRRVVQRVGGMRREFGKWGDEHVEWSRRIHAAGLTTFPFADLHGSGLYSMDESTRDPRFARSVPAEERDAGVARGATLLPSFDGTTDYVEYRELPNVAITTLLTRHADPQRPGQKMTPAALTAWRGSLKGCTPVVLADQAEGEGIVTVPVGLKNAYRQRWVSILQYLRQHPAHKVLVTDGTDVVMLREPWEEMDPGVLYIGYEPQVVGIPWMLQHHPTHREWIVANGHRTLLNGGVVGGDYATMLEFTQAVVTEMARSLPDRDIGDMALVNKVAYDLFGDRLVTGPHVVTTFKAEETNAFSWMKHK